MKKKSFKSKILAQVFKNHFSRDDLISPIAVSGTPLYLLEFANMPSLQIEIGYLTNTLEEKNLVDSEFQNKIAKNICNNIRYFFNNYN